MRMMLSSRSAQNGNYVASVRRRSRGTGARGDRGDRVAPSARGRRHGEHELRRVPRHGTSRSPRGVSSRAGFVGSPERGGPADTFGVRSVRGQADLAEVRAARYRLHMAGTRTTHDKRRHLARRRRRRRRAAGAFSLPRRIVAGTLDEASHLLHGAATKLGKVDPLDSRVTALEKRLDCSRSRRGDAAAAHNSRAAGGAPA